MQLVVCPYSWRAGAVPGQGVAAQVPESGSKVANKRLRGPGNERASFQRPKPEGESNMGKSLGRFDDEVPSCIYMAFSAGRVEIIFSAGTIFGEAVTSLTRRTKRAAMTIKTPPATTAARRLLSRMLFITQPKPSEAAISGRTIKKLKMP